MSGRACPSPSIGGNAALFPAAMVGPHYSSNFIMLSHEPHCEASSILFATADSFNRSRIAGDMSAVTVRTSIGVKRRTARVKAISAHESPHCVGLKSVVYCSPN